MKNYLGLLLIPFFLSLGDIYAQDTPTQSIRAIRGDSSYWYNAQRGLREKFDLPDFLTSTDEFNFRFWNHNQIVTIQKNGEDYKGEVINYIFQYQESRSEFHDTLYQRSALSSETVKMLYDHLIGSDILALPSDKGVKGWQFGLDGRSYVFEFTDSGQYYFNTYWSPAIQDSLEEAVVVKNVAKYFSDTLGLKNGFRQFQSTLPNRYCYLYGGYYSMCYVSNTINVGYLGSARLPSGISFSSVNSYLGKANLNVWLISSYQFGRGKSHDFSLELGKSNLFFKRKVNVWDGITYNYRNRNLSYLDVQNVYEGHKLMYRILVRNNWTFGAGLDVNETRKLNAGGIIYAHKNFQRVNLSFSGRASIFNNRWDHKFSIYKSIYFNKIDFPYGSRIGISYEKVNGIKDLSVSILVGIYRK